MVDAPGYYDQLEFNAPLSSARADALAAALAARHPDVVLDIGCGWGELLLRTVAAAPATRGIGWDVDDDVLARARAAADSRGLGRRAQFVTADPGDAADALVCIGSEHVYGDQAEALRQLCARVRPGGVVLFGTAYWRHTPSVEQAAAVGETPESFGILADVVDLAIAAGLRPLDIQTATEDEWNAFESGYLADWEEWLHRHPDDPRAPELRGKADSHRAEWLRGYRDVLGWTYLTLGRAH